MRAQRLCLRCKDVRLQPLEELAEEVTFLECPACGRQFAERRGKSLCFRWLHPISLVLYPVIFDASPAQRAGEIAHEIAQGRSHEDLAAMLQEIRLELDEPTERVRDILDCRAPEKELRRFLRSVTEHWERALSGGGGGE